MGMYDYINFSTKCPLCEAVVEGFQSKDSERVLATLDFWEVDNFYSSCKNCHAWIEYDLIRPCSITIDKYKQTVIARDKGFSKGVSNGNV